MVGIVGIVGMVVMVVMVGMVSMVVMVGFVGLVPMVTLVEMVEIIVIVGSMQGSMWVYVGLCGSTQVSMCICAGTFLRGGGEKIRILC